MNIRQKIIHQKNWKLKIRITLLVPLLLVMVYIVAQTGTIDMSSITGFATLSAKGNDNDNNDNIPAGLSNEILNENDYSIFAADSSDKENDKDKDRSEKDKDESVPDNDNNNSEGENDDTQDQEPPVLGGGGGSSGDTPDEEPVITQPVNGSQRNDDISTGGGRPPIENFWGTLTIDGNLSGAGKIIIARINDVEYQSLTDDKSYYTVTVPGIEGATVDFIYDGDIIATDILRYGAVLNLNLSVCGVI